MHSQNKNNLKMNNLNEEWKQFYKSKSAGIFKIKAERNNIWWISNHGSVKITTDWNDNVRYPNLSLISKTEYANGIGYVAISINCAPEKYVHRLVARYFLAEPEHENQIVVDHIDENKHNNNADNLQWLTYKENTAKTRLLNKSKK